MKETSESVKYDRGGLPSVTLEDVTVRHCQPCGEREVVLVALRVGLQEKRLEELTVPTRTAAVFWRTRALAIEASQLDVGTRSFANRLDGQRHPPVVAEVIAVRQPNGGDERPRLAGALSLLGLGSLLVAARLGRAFERRLEPVGPRTRARA